VTKLQQAQPFSQPATSWLGFCFDSDRALRLNMTRHGAPKPMP
jgi:hypothetical protein